MATTALFLTLTVLLPQGSDGTIAARYHDGDQQAVVSRDDLALEFAHRFERTDRGARARDHAVDLELVRARATAAGLLPDLEETRRWVEALDQKLRDSGYDLERQLATQGMSRGEFLDFARLSLAHERLVQRSLDLRSRDEVTPDMQQLWLKEARLKARIQTDPRALTPGIVATVDGREITSLDLGHALLRSADPKDREQYIQQIVWRRSVESAARKHGVTVTPAEAEAEVKARQRQMERDPSLGGLTFEQLLQTQGMTPEDLARAPVLRALLLEQKLSRKLHPDGELEQQIDQDRDGTHARFGARRKLEAIVVGFGDDGRLTAIDHARVQAAKERIERLHKEATGGTSFSGLARRYSEDPRSRVQGGSMDWRHRADAEVPEEILEAAFALPLHGISEPIQTETGFYLIRVADIEPVPDRATVLRRMRDDLITRHRLALLKSARLEILSR